MLSTGLDEDIVVVAAGKEFTLVRTAGGRVCNFLIIYMEFRYLKIEKCVVNSLIFNLRLVCN